MKSEDELLRIEMQKIEDDAMLAKARFNSLFNDDEFLDQISDYVKENSIQNPNW